ncbi:hypothetical protein [Ferviditalea candida]|uniref:Uncharacterized protein n=1 Tax=Ferviditalea candida TaxID=3108399 RepID=A0ABU5ZDN4_9BACL|nr:hypothetical protein [Paenibacillaceae bacterium T2]
MKKSFLVIIIIVSAVAGIMFWNSDEQKDRRIWNQFKSTLTTENIEKATYAGISEHTFSQIEKEKVLQWLRESDFAKSNRIAHGPTPKGLITLHFKDGTVQHFGFWGGATFETSPRHFDAKSQFLVASEELGDFISQYDVN